MPGELRCCPKCSSNTGQVAIYPAENGTFQAEVQCCNPNCAFRIGRVEGSTFLEAWAIAAMTWNDQSQEEERQKKVACPFCGDYPTVCHEEMDSAAWKIRVRGAILERNEAVEKARQSCVYCKATINPRYAVNGVCFDCVAKEIAGYDRETAMGIIKRVKRLKREREYHDDDE